MTTSFPPINYPNKPVPPFTAEPPRNPFPGFFPDMWRNITGKPYITVSSKGLANGLSEYINDGADFGPDSLQADGSLTQTCGIQEAVVYIEAVITNKPVNWFTQGVIMLRSMDTFILGKTVNFIVSCWHNIISQGRGGATIRGASGFTGPYFMQAYTAGGEDTQFKGIVFEPPVGASGGTYSVFNSATGSTYIIGDTHFDQCYFGTYPENFADTIHVSVQTYSISFTQCFGSMGLEITGIPSNYLFVKILHSHLKGIILNPSGKLTTLSIDSSDFWEGPLTSNSLTGYILINPAGNSANEYYTQINISDSMWDNSGNTLIVNNQPANMTGVKIDGLTARYSTTATYLVQSANALKSLDVRNAGICNSAGTDLLPIPLYTSGSAVVTATIPANPPVSATVYQNTNPYDIEIDLPVYATTSGTAGYVTIAKGATDTPTAISSQYVSGDTSSTSTQIIRLRVPAGWYYEFTGSGVTFGTATPFAE